MKAHNTICASPKAEKTFAEVSAHFGITVEDAVEIAARLVKRDLDAGRIRVRKSKRGHRIALTTPGAFGKHQ